MEFLAPDMDEKPFYNVLELQTYLAAEAGLERFAGVVLIAEADNIIFERAYGLAHPKHQVRNRSDTRFNIGSLNKLFTSVAILQLAESGMLQLDDPLSRFRSDFAADVAERVTIRHLLQHRSGWGGYWDNPTYLANWRWLTMLDDYIAFIKDIPLDFAPGARRQYSNTGFEVLGAIIECVSGQRYDDYVEQSICRPANMVATAAFDSDASQFGRAIGLTNWPLPGSDQQPVTLRVNLDYPLSRGTAAGGGYSTARDLFTFGLALRRHKLLSPHSTALLLNDFEGDSVQQLQQTACYGGGAPGINAFFALDFGSEHTVIVLVNRDPPLAENLGFDIIKMLKPVIAIETIGS